ncbi:hypothetical protein NDU88_001189 [Pleurodeles waltl]|uniref:Uncharacterized protein n=1 Tax=Pleurodeles waltl TaxID=8319 RepID=A0AAV7R9I8_PLEWA|nr:hypothetical protein NDU88_001189 [Pleurodeles waltl]
MGHDKPSQTKAAQTKIDQYRAPMDSGTGKTPGVVKETGESPTRYGNAFEGNPGLKGGIGVQAPPDASIRRALKPGRIRGDFVMHGWSGTPTSLPPITPRPELTLCGFRQRT